MMDWLDQTVVKECKRAARAANLPKSFIDAIHIEKGVGGYELVNDWKKDDKPLAVWFNYGTKDHWVAPKDKKALAWKNTEGRNASAIYFRGGQNYTDKGNIRRNTLFSKGHYVSGLPRTEAMEQGRHLGIPRLNRLIEREIKKKTREFRSQGVGGKVRHG